MKIISLNLARRNDLGRGYGVRLQNIIKFLDDEHADVVCFQEIAFGEGKSQADEINQLMHAPYKHVLSELSKKCKIADVAPLDRSTSMRKMYEKDKAAIFTDGLAMLSNHEIEKSEKIVLTKVEPDERSRPDRHTRIAQNVDFNNGLKLSNVHFASNQNAYIQLDELIRKNDGDRLIIGDLNLTHEQMQKHRDVWSREFIDSTEFLDYVSFPADGATYDHLLLPKSCAYRFTSIRTIDDLSDHSAVVFSIEER
jgi:endonuclease/exonuclease/phosphatase family metal-dependent hydrolase